MTRHATTSHAMPGHIIDILTGGEELPAIMSVHLLGDYLGYLRRPAVRAAILAEDGSDDTASYDELLAEVETMHRRLVGLVGVDDRGRPVAGADVLVEAGTDRR